MKEHRRIITLTLVVSLLCVGALFLSSCDSKSIIKKDTINPITGEVDNDLPARPVIVSVPNAPDGAVPQSNLSKADIIYEFPVEAALTRLQVVYYSEFPEMVGPVRSVRYYFVEMQREYFAAHVGYGWGKYAHASMYYSELPHINGMEDTELFDRVDFKEAPNNAYISWDKVMARAEKEGWFDDVQTIRPWKFRDEEYQKEVEKAKETIKNKSGSKKEKDIEAVKAAKAIAEEEEASSIHVYSGGCDSECIYDPEKDCYKRYWYGEEYIDRETGEQLTFKNILIQYVDSNLWVDEETGELDPKGRIQIDMQKGGKGMLFTNGKVVKGTWTKADRDSRTIFVDENGNEFRFSIGKTWVYVCDGNMTCEYK